MDSTAPETFFARAVPLTPASALAQGVTREQLRHSALRAVMRGVYVANSVADSAELRCDAALTVYPAAVLSHDTAVPIYQLTNAIIRPRTPFERSPHDGSAIHLTVAPPNPKPKRRGVCGHVRELSSEEVRCWRGWRLTSPSRTFVDLAEFWSTPDLIALGDAILRQELATLSELSTAVAAAGRRRGVVRARYAVANLDARSASAMESITRARLVMAGLPKPEVNVDIHDDFGRRIACPDLYYRAARLALEYDGAHHKAAAQYDSDVGRDMRYSDAGIQVVRVTAREALVLFDQLTETVRRLLAERSRRPNR